MGGPAEFVLTFAEDLRMRGEVPLKFALLRGVFSVEEFRLDDLGSVGVRLDDAADPLEGVTDRGSVLEFLGECTEIIRKKIIDPLGR